MNDPYPEHTKLKKISDQSQTIGGFLDWLENETEMFIAVWQTGNWDDDRGMPARRSIDSLLAQGYVSFAELSEIRSARFKLPVEKDDSLASTLAAFKHRRYPIPEWLA